MKLQLTKNLEDAALNVRQASQFAAAQAFGTSLVWRGSVLMLVKSAFHEMLRYHCVHNDCQACSQWL